VVICLERDVNDLHVVISYSLKSRLVLTFLVPAYPRSPEKEAVKWVSCYMYRNVSMSLIHRASFLV